MHAPFGSLAKARGIRPVAVLAALAAVSLAAAGPAGAAPRKDLVTNVGIIGLAVTNLGYVGNGLNNQNQPSCEYPLRSHVEHLFLGGLWVGAVDANGRVRVTTGAQDAASLEAGDEIREFWDSEETDEQVQIWSNSQNSDRYDPRALATQHFQCVFVDYPPASYTGRHRPLGLKVILRALAWGSPYADDFVILDYAIVNISDGELRDVYVGFWNDTTVGNTQITNPYDSQAAVRWDYYDDVNGAWGPAEWVPDPATQTPAGDPHVWMMYERDDDGEEGMATSWVGTRLLGASPAVQPPAGRPPVSYNSWRFRGVPAQDSSYVVGTEERIGKYQLMGNGDFDVGETQAEDFRPPSDWIGLMSTGPFPVFAANDTIHVTFAIACGPDSLGLLANSKVAQVAYEQGFTIPGGPPSPRLDVAFDNNRAILSWAPGDSVGVVPPGTEPVVLPPDDPRRSPEHHVSTITGKPDFQGYRIYRYQGETISSDPYRLATMVAEFDRIDGIGFDTGLPPLDAQGRRVLVDDHLLDGFPYWYSVVSFSAPDLEEGLPEFQSGFNENAWLGFPGSAPATPEDKRAIGVYPNPYRAGSLFDSPRGEVELGRKIWFTGLPARCQIQVFNLAGHLVKTLDHDDPVSGTEPWDILSEPVRAIATGLYVYVVEDLATGEIQRGKLVIIK